jgi:hypothetical protein
MAESDDGLGPYIETLNFKVCLSRQNYLLDDSIEGRLCLCQKAAGFFVLLCIFDLDCTA